MAERLRNSFLNIHNQEKKKRRQAIQTVLPESVDYRPYLTPIKYQGKCGACW